MRKKRMLLVALSLVLAGEVAFAEGKKEEAKKEKLWTRTTPTVVVGFGAGGGTDTSVRPVVAKMQEYLGETINVVNMSGASSAVAAEHVLGAAADGYTMFATGSGPLSIFRVMDLSKSSWRDWVGWHPFVGPAALLVKPDSPIKTFDDAIKVMKEKTLNFAISGYGVGPHVLAEAIFAVAGVKKVNYVTAGSCRESAVNTISGETDIAMCTFSAAVDFVKAGQLVALTVTAKEPYVLAGKPPIPAITSVLKGADHVPLLAETWPILIRRDTPQKVLDRLTEAFLWAIKQPEIVQYAEKQALKIAGYYGEEADRFCSISEAGYAWTVFSAGLAKKSPADFGIPQIADWNWEAQKATIKK